MYSYLPLKVLENHKNKSNNWASNLPEDSIEISGVWKCSGAFGGSINGRDESAWIFGSGLISVSSCFFGLNTKIIILGLVLVHSMEKNVKIR